MAGRDRQSVDAVVIGSGAAGLTAALALRHAGADVMLVEAEDVLGGTSAIGGGNLWIPGSSPMARAGYGDDLDAAATYLRRVGGTQPRSDNIDAFIGHGARMVDFIEARGALRFTAIPRHDYHPDWDGAGFGRSLEPEPFSAGALLQERAGWFRTNAGRAPLTYVEYRAGGNPATVAMRREEDIRTQGAALVAGLGYSCIDMGVDMVRSVAVNAVKRQQNGRFAIELADGRDVDAASVVIASGGFAADPAKRRALLPAVDFVPLTAGRAMGDGLRFGLDCGADLFGLGDGWLGAVHAPDDGRPPFLVVRELALPGSMLVNGDGHRFVNEALGYNDVGRGMLAFDPARGSYFCARAWLIFDAAFKARSPVLGIAPSDSAPMNWRQADDLVELARKLSMPADALKRSAERMNEAADNGNDKDFGRGGDPHQRFNGDPSHVPNPCLGEISTPPYYAAPILPGLCGTKGGLLVDAEARVLDRSGDPIRGLYACGDVAPTIMGFGYAGAGASLGPGMTAALLAAEAIARDSI
ncbi:FAD-dependent oxidoreductase [Sphingobium sp. Cam5-1]|uniref:FAD-dependent oxidoreductase n=1 Tax=Sphingobium sp. Cam5-1 TaxID=2789327 RepID=UPI0018AD2C22|nr:FAD-dependent oxidoreductase [Sphingobium sp. Cam5-1]QPI74628.1 FAD-dependent oxidoreductase [Sphingobium sp. Cam5-1]